MTRHQKIILAILAVLDIAVIGAMGTYAVVTTRRARSAPPPYAGPEACVATVLAAFAGPEEAAVADWAPAGARLDVTRPAASPDELPAQAIWDALSRLPGDLADVCPTPETLTLTVHTVAPNRMAETAVLPGAPLMAWLRGELTDDELATQTHYRVVSAEHAP